MPHKTESRLPTEEMCQKAWKIVLEAIYAAAKGTPESSAVDGMIMVINRHARLDGRPTFEPIFRKGIRPIEDTEIFVRVVSKANARLKLGSNAGQGGTVYGDIIVAYYGNSSPELHRTFEMLMAHAVTTLMKATSE